MGKILDFYDVSEKKKFRTGKYIIKIVKGRRFAVAKNRKGKQCWRILGKA